MLLNFAASHRLPDRPPRSNRLLSRSGDAATLRVTRSHPAGRVSRTVYALMRTRWTVDPVPRQFVC
jgi:hypothetical protein